MTKKIKTKIKNVYDEILLDKNSAVFNRLIKDSHYWFFMGCLSEYITYKIAPFQKEMFALTEDSSITRLVIVAARGSGKSTLMTLSLPLWAVFGRLQKKYIMIISQTMEQSKQHLKNIKMEIESNEILRKYFGPFDEEEGGEWGSQSIYIPKYKARIAVASTGQDGKRGLKTGSHRPDLVIMDDIEDINSVKTKEMRDKIFNWATSDIFPIGDKNVNFVFVGNLLHNDSFLMKLKAEAEKEESTEWVYREYPIADEDGNPLWPGKYASKEEIERERKNTLNDVAFQREYMLKIISDEGSIITPEMIQYYDEVPNVYHHMTYTGVDLASSQKDTADYTAMVSLHACGRYEDMKFYIMPNPVNRRIPIADQAEQIKICHKNLGGYNRNKVFVENNFGGNYLVNQLKGMDVRAEEIGTGSMSKGSRLGLATLSIKSIFFPRKGAENLIAQLIGFGTENHDDMVDAFSYAVLGANKDNANIGHAKGHSGPRPDAL
jgi:phage terminase large subunit-like protein